MHLTPDLTYLGLILDMVFEEMRDSMNGFVASIPNEQERKSKIRFEMNFKKSFSLHFNPL